VGPVNAGTEELELELVRNTITGTVPAEERWNTAGSVAATGISAGALPASL
jgi:hypothetical protein